MKPLVIIMRMSQSLLQLGSCFVYHCMIPSPPLMAHDIDSQWLTPNVPGSCLWHSFDWLACISTECLPAYPAWPYLILSSICSGRPNEKEKKDNPDIEFIYYLALLWCVLVVRILGNNRFLDVLLSFCIFVIKLMNAGISTNMFRK